MKKFFNKEVAKQMWLKVMDSTKENMSRGAQSLNRIITWARGENWRGKKEKKK